MSEASIEKAERHVRKASHSGSRQ